MTHPAMQNPDSNNMMLAQAELLQTVLESELCADAAYPWNAAAAEQYFDQLEAETPATELGEAEAEQFFSKLDQLWEQQPTADSIGLANLAEGLAARCISIPQAALATLATQATALVGSQLSALDQLVACVQEVLPQWDVEDLQVMARPYAYAMRSQEQKLPENVDWESLSEVEQGRLAMAIANWIMTELENRKN